MSTSLSPNTEQHNQQIVLANHPDGVPTRDTFRIEDIVMPGLQAGQVLIKSLYISVDPGMRGFMNQGKDDAAGQKFAIGDPITSRSVAQVVDSQHPDYTRGDIVHGRFAWKKFQLVTASQLEKVDPAIAPISTSVSMLGVPGLAAYFGLLSIGKASAGETVVVSGAAGAVGSMAAQFAKIKGCKVVGIAGSDEKINYLEHELAIDKAINYKTTEDMASAIQQACPDGVDVFFDNVGGELFDAVFANINRYARIVICGQIAEYNDLNPPQGPRPMHQLIKKSALMQGFVVFDFEDSFDAAKQQIAQWYRAGKIHYRETLIDGFTKLPDAFIGLFTGDNIGKQLVKVADIDSSTD